MRYYVVSDVHSHYTLLKKALTEKGYFDDAQPHMLIMLGDLFDRGEEPHEMQAFVLSLLSQNRVILVRGNHEDLMEELVQNIRRWMNPLINVTHHRANGTVDTLLSLTGMSLTDAIAHPTECAERMRATPYFQTILPAMRDYYETTHYLFVHGWIPCIPAGRRSDGRGKFIYDPAWREAKPVAWQRARWYNGMIAAAEGVREPEKITVCGHYTCAYGHAVYEKKGEIRGPRAIHTPYEAPGILAIDAHTAVSHTVNCVLLEDTPLP